MNPSDPRNNGFYDPNLVVDNQLPLVQNQYANGVYTPESKPKFRIFRFAAVLVVTFVLGATSVIGYWKLIGSKPSTPKKTTASTSSSTETKSTTDATPGSKTGGLSGAAQDRDAEREFDIRALAVQVENYYVHNAVYPTLKNLNDPAWVKTNMSSLDLTALKDPKGKDSVIAAAPDQNVYSYQPVNRDGDTCDNLSPITSCVSYTLTASTEAGGIFVKKSPNQKVN